MKKEGLLALCILMTNIIIGQTNQPKSEQEIKFDKIILLDKTSVECKVVRVTESTIEIDPSGPIPFEIIDRSKVDAIIYSDNTVVKFPQSKKSSPQEILGNNSNELKEPEWNCFTYNSDLAIGHGNIRIKEYGSTTATTSEKVSQKKVISCKNYQLNIEVDYQVIYKRQSSFNPNIAIYIKSIEGGYKITDNEGNMIDSYDLGWYKYKVLRNESYSDQVGMFEYKGVIFKVYFSISKWSYDMGVYPNRSISANTVFYITYSDPRVN